MSPAAITRVGSALPEGYEVGSLTGPLSAAALWGFGRGWTAEPPQCAPLADPAPGDPTARGLSASGPGGSVFVVAAVGPDSPPGAGLLSECGHWTMRFGHTTAEVTRTEGPPIEGVPTIAWRAAARTVVESGNQTTSSAETAIAYLEGHVAFVTVVTDPGSPHPPLDSGFTADLLVTAVSALRG